MGACTGTQKQKQSKVSSITECSITQDILECSLCFNKFDLVQRMPMMICINQHNICDTCLSNYSNFRNEKCICPFCRSDINVQNICRNRLLMEVLKQKKSNSYKKQQTYQQKLDRVLSQARSCNIQKIVYHIERGVNLLTIKELHLWDLKITKILDLSLFGMLSVLDLNKNQIEYIELLDELTQLKYLNLSYNRITKIDNLQKLLKLQFLDLCHNLIPKIQHLDMLENLSTLNMSNNQITIVQNLYQLKKLSILYLKNNPIRITQSKGSLDALIYRQVLVELSHQKFQK